MRVCMGGERAYVYHQYKCGRRMKGNKNENDTINYKKIFLKTWTLVILKISDKVHLFWIHLLIHKTQLLLELLLLFGHQIIPDSLQPHGPQPARLLCSWDFPGKNKGSGLPCPPPGDLPGLGIKPESPAFSLLQSHQGRPPLEVGYSIISVTMQCLK